LLNTGVAVIPFRRCPSRRLFLAAVGLAIVGPLAVELLKVLAIGPTGPGLALTIFNFYPLTAWLALMLVRMGIGRLSLGSTAVAASLVGVGVALAVIGFGCGALVDTYVTYQEPSESSSESSSSSASFAESGTMDSPSAGYWDRIEYGGPIVNAVDSVLSSSPHSGGILELFGSGGFAMAVIGMCVLSSRGLRWMLTPLAAMGSMPLTAYVAHVVIVFVVSGGPAGTFTQTMGLWAWSAAGVIGGCAVWKANGGRGPLERLVAASASIAARH